MAGGDGVTGCTLPRYDQAELIRVEGDSSNGSDTDGAEIEGGTCGKV